MPLCHVRVNRYFSNRLESYGYFVIDSPHSVQSEVLSSLTAKDMNEIGYRLGIARYPDDLPSHTEFHLIPVVPNPLDLPQMPTFTSEAGDKMWTFRKFREIPF